MRFVVLDFETYFDDEYTLRKMTTEAYIRDPRFEAHGAAIKWQANIPARWYDEKELRYVFKQEDWSDIILCAHHAHFDGLILNHHYDVRPRKWCCTLAIARQILGNHLSVSLDSVRRHFGMPSKSTPYGLFKGRHWNELDRTTQQQVGDGACDEVESIWRLFGMFSKSFPPDQYEYIDTTIRMFTQPMLRADIDLLAKIWQDENNAKHARMASLGVSVDQLQSADKFAELLRKEGIEPETKTSPKGNEIYAFAKNDEFMYGLLDDSNERVRALAEARLGAKSTIMQTRAETYGFMAQRGPLCVYLKPYGADTMRPSGGDKGNFLNLKRPDPDNPKAGSPIRKSLMAPEGYLLAPVDLSQGEFRIGAYVAEHHELLEKLRVGVDPYIDIASKFYHEQIYKPKSGDPREIEMKQKRGCGKQAMLMCQYGCAAPKFQKTAAAGLYGPSVDMSIDEAERFVNLYRDENYPVVNYWKTGGRMLSRLAGGPPLDWGPLHIKDKRLYAPNGLYLHFETLEYHRPTQEEIDELDLPRYKWDGFWRVKTRNGWKEIWGSKLLQNICEFLQQCVVVEAMNRITRRGYRVLNHPYDELLCLVPKDGREEKHLEILIAEMKQAPSWLPNIPLDAEGSLGERYDK
ncbi:MAG TPA: hypothetical protein VLJ17_24715 [Xanthobacteraceae bacterium]|nr:hypothetical protein [Xanthobacteraceae bacterium]